MKKLNNYYINNKYISLISLSFTIFILSNIGDRKENLKVCLCTLGKEENRYIREYIEHYKNYGVEKIFLYDNNDINGEHFESIIRISRNI